MHHTATASDPAADPRTAPGVPRSSSAGVLHHAVDAALDHGDGERLHDCARIPLGDERDELLTTMLLHDLWMAPLDRLGHRVRMQCHPAAVALKTRLEDRLLGRVRSRAEPTRRGMGDGVAGMRRVAALDLVPDVYEWLRTEADLQELVEFLSVEGGPDAGFDDLVAVAQVGIVGDAKVALAQNYWDEMGQGSPAAVHTQLHHDLVDAVDLPRIPRAELPVPALERVAIGGVLATNRRLQPELLGALGLLEMQAGPRCRAVVAALRRLHAPAGALPFYEEHAVADPRHGKEWLDRVVAPLSQDPNWARRMVDGATWRHEVNRRFFAHTGRPLGVGAAA